MLQADMVITEGVQPMAKQDQTENATPGRGGAAGIGADQGDSVPAPKPSASAAASAGAVGPGALAAAEKPSEASRIAPPERATEAGGGLTHDEMETLRGLVQRVGGVDTLIRWLQLHPDLK
jgi:hypothetical protein